MVPRMDLSRRYQDSGAGELNHTTGPALLSCVQVLCRRVYKIVSGIASTRPLGEKRASQ